MSLAQNRRHRPRRFPPARRACNALLAERGKTFLSAFPQVLTILPSASATDNIHLVEAFAVLPRGFALAMAAGDFDYQGRKIFHLFEPTHFFRHRINAGRAQRIAFQHPPEGEPATGDKAMTGNCLIAVFRAGWKMAAGISDDRRQGQLIGADQADADRRPGVLRQSPCQFRALEKIRFVGPAGRYRLAGQRTRNLIPALRQRIQCMFFGSLPFAAFWPFWPLPRFPRCNRPPHRRSEGWRRDGPCIRAPAQGI